MKNKNLVLLALMVFTQTSYADSQGKVIPGYQQVEIPVGQVFVPHFGFDDNDSIEFVIDGVMPNGCYQLGQPEVRTDLSTRLIHVRLFAYHSTDPLCAQDDHVPPSLLGRVPYTLEVHLGILPPGNYVIVYPSPGIPDEKTTFTVIPAKVASVDDYPYAAVSAVNIPDVVPGDANIEVTLTGTLTSTCSQLLPENIQMRRQKDVFVILPKLSLKKGICTQVMVPFQVTVNLGKAEEGRYLIHARSMNGHSINRTFSAVMPDPALN